VSDRHFTDRLLEAVETKRSQVVVGLDPDYASLPPQVIAALEGPEFAEERVLGEGRGCGQELERKAACYRLFLRGILEALQEEAVAVKLQVAYFEALGAAGWAVYEETARLARELGYLVIADVKRGDIGSTAEAYAAAHLDHVGADAVTVNPYFGTDGLEPFFRRAREQGKGVFVLVKTSNPSSAELQDLELAGGGRVYERVADLVSEWGRGTEGRLGYRLIGAVVGGTHPEEGSRLRARLERVPFLVPGYGAQGARAEDVVCLFDARGTGAVVNSARAILYAYRKRPEVNWREAARQEAREMKDALWRVTGRG